MISRKTLFASLLGLALTASALGQAPLDREALDTALTQLPRVEYGDDRALLDGLDRFVAAAGTNRVLRAELENRFITVIYSDGTLAAKDYACRSLRLVGSPKCVPALASLLSHPQLSGLARYGLEPLPFPEAGAALRDALPLLEPRQQIGVVTSLAARRDAGAVSVIEPLIRVPDERLAEAAIVALGKIGSEQAAALLGGLHEEAEGTRKTMAARACLEVAWTLLDDGKAVPATTMFATVLGSYPNGHSHEAAFEGLIAAQPKRANGRLLAALRGDDERLRNLAGRLVAERPMRRTPPRFVAELPDLPPAGQVALLNAFAARGDGSTRDAMLGVLTNAPTEVKLAAVRALGSVGRPVDAVRLARLAVSDQPEAAVARASLINLPGDAVDAAILRAASRSQTRAAVRIELIRALSERNAYAQAGTLVECLADADSGVRRATAATLGDIGTEAEIPGLIARLGGASEEVQRDALAGALEMICGRVREAASAPMLAGIQAAAPAEKAVLLRLLGAVGGNEALTVLRQAVASRDEDLRDAAVRALTEWPDSTAAADLVAIVRQPATPAHRVLALRGYVRLVRESSLDTASKLDHLQSAMDLAQSDDERRLVIGALGDAASVDAMQYVAQQLNRPELADEAGAAAVRIATALGAEKKEAIAPVLRAVIEKATAKPVTDSARLLKRKLKL